MLGSQPVRDVDDEVAEAREHQPHQPVRVLRQQVEPRRRARRTRQTATAGTMDRPVHRRGRGTADDGHTECRARPRRRGAPGSPRGEAGRRSPATRRTCLATSDRARCHSDGGIWLRRACSANAGAVVTDGWRKLQRQRLQIGVTFTSRRCPLFCTLRVTVSPTLAGLSNSPVGIGAVVDHLAVASARMMSPSTQPSAVCRVGVRPACSAALLGATEMISIALVDAELGGVPNRWRCSTPRPGRD